jgi:putative RNA 2'-phosphotransferase
MYFCKKVYKMRTEKELIKTSRYISKLLRHNPEDLQMDSNGWININDLLNKINISLEELNIIVETNDKKRFRYNEDKSKIRANQGHSINVDVQLDVKEPPHKLYHGTAYRNKESILKNGIVKMKRQNVHLSQDNRYSIKCSKKTL